MEEDKVYSTIKLYDGEIELLKLMQKEYIWSYTNEDSLLKKIIKQIVRPHENVISRRIIVKKRK
tara:strand:+ start:3045 stop:3236 length:192 start_codon:yes stop_codon:yes gene_type:complete